MRLNLNEAALRVADVDGPLPIVASEGTPIADACRAELRMVRMMRDLATQLRNAGITGTLEVLPNVYTSLYGTRSATLRVCAAGADGYFDIEPGVRGLTRSGRIRSVSGDPHGYLRAEGGALARVSLNHGREALRSYLHTALATSLAGATWSQEAAGAKLCDFDADSDLLWLDIKGPDGRVVLTTTWNGVVQSVAPSDDLGRRVRLPDSFENYMLGRALEEFGVGDLPAFTARLRARAHAHLPVLAPGDS